MISPSMIRLVRRTSGWTTALRLSAAAELWRRPQLRAEVASAATTSLRPLPSVNLLYLPCGPELGQARVTLQARNGELFLRTQGLQWVQRLWLQIREGDVVRLHGCRALPEAGVFALRFLNGDGGGRDGMLWHVPAHVDEVLGLTARSIRLRLHGGGRRLELGPVELPGLRHARTSPLDAGSPTKVERDLLALIAAYNDAPGDVACSLRALLAPRPKKGGRPGTRWPELSLWFNLWVSTLIAEIEAAGAGDLVPADVLGHPQLVR